MGDGETTIAGQSDSRNVSVFLPMLHSQRNATTFTVFGIEFRNFVYNTNRAEKAHPCDALRECIHASLPVVGIEGTRSILATARRSGILGCVRCGGESAK